MVDPVHEARLLVDADLARFETTLAAALEPQAEYLSETEYETYRRGKKLRPLILLLSSRVCTGSAEELPQKVINASVSLEMLHVATLIHDDIVDVAPIRRGLGTVFAERGTEMAVLIGDLQFIQAIRCFADGIDTQKDMQVVKMVLDIGFQICCGELDEILTDPLLDAQTLEKRYLRTVNRKTAALFALACESGALLAGAGKTEAFHLGQFGRRFGVAFQIMDDIFDFVRPEELSGKAPGKGSRAGTRDVAADLRPARAAGRSRGASHPAPRAVHGKRTARHRPRHRAIGRNAARLFESAKDRAGGGRFSVDVSGFAVSQCPDLHGPLRDRPRVFVAGGVGVFPGECIARAPLIRLRHLLPIAMRLRWGEGYLFVLFARLIGLAQRGVRSPSPLRRGEKVPKADEGRSCEDRP